MPDHLYANRCYFLWQRRYLYELLCRNLTNDSRVYGRWQCLNIVEWNVIRRCGRYDAIIATWYHKSEWKRLRSSEWRVWKGLNCIVMCGVAKAAKAALRRRAGISDTAFRKGYGGVWSTGIRHRDYHQRERTVILEWLWPNGRRVRLNRQMGSDHRN